MMMRRMVHVAMLALPLAGCAAPDERVPAETREVAIRWVDTVAVTSDADPNEILCKRVARPGSHFKQILCGTRAEWEAERRRAEVRMRRVMQRNAANWQDW